MDTKLEKQTLNAKKIIRRFGGGTVDTKPDEQWLKEHPLQPQQDLEQWIKDHPFVDPFKPCAWYNKDGDQLEVYWDNSSPYGEEIKGESGKSVMCLMRSQEGKVPVGVTIYSIRKLLQEAGLTIVPKYWRLQIDAPASDAEIWIGDEWGNFVQKGVGFLETRLLPGKYTVEFGLGQPQHVIDLTQDTQYDSRQKESGDILKET